MAAAVGDRLITATERLGWPPPPRWRWWHWLWLRPLWPLEVQDRLVYEDQADTPTATCHLQVSEESPALCDYPWEILVAVPGNPPFESLEEWLRCDECAKAARPDSSGSDAACPVCGHRERDHPIPADPNLSICAACVWEEDEGRRSEGDMCTSTFP